MSDVRTIWFDESAGELTAVGRYGNKFITTPHVFELLGFEREDKLFRLAGALKASRLGRFLRDPIIRACDGAIRTYKDGFVSNLYGTGAAAATRQNPNIATVPGVLGQLPGTAATIAVRNLLER